MELSNPGSQYGTQQKSAQCLSQSLQRKDKNAFTEDKYSFLYWVLARQNISNRVCVCVCVCVYVVFVLEQFSAPWFIELLNVLL